MTGGTGADTFKFGLDTAKSTDSTATVTDKITDFVGGSDKIMFNVAATFASVTHATITNAATLALAVDAAFAVDVDSTAGIQALQFTYGTKTYFAVEAGATTNGLDALVVEVTGVTGTVAVADFVAIA